MENIKKILGLDIGTTSIGWAIVEATDEKKANENNNKVAETDINNNRIGIHKDAVGVRIIAQDTERFDKGLTLNDPKGSTLTPTANRRKYRGVRRMKSRYKLRRGKLENVLAFLNITKDERYYTNERKFDDEGNRIRRGENNDIGKAIYELRDRAIREKITLAELGRVLLHINQWRGYSSDRFAIEEKAKFEYLIGTITYLSEKPIKIDYEKYDSTKVSWMHYAVEIKLEEPFKIDEENFITEILNARIIVKEEINLTKKQGDIIAFNYKEQDIKEKNKKVGSFNKISLTKVNPDDWNFKYQELQKTLTEWCSEGKTVGSYFYHNFYENKKIERIRNNVVNRNWYEDELDKIWDFQYQYHKNFLDKVDIKAVVKIAFKDYQPILDQINNYQIEYFENGVKKKRSAKESEQLKYLLKDKLIFFQRPWQQAKNKGQCPFEKIKVKKEKTVKGEGRKEVFDIHIGRTVIPRSHPLHQEFKIWQQINNVRVYLNTPNERIDLLDDLEQFKKYVGKEVSDVKELLFNEMQKSKTLSWRVFVKESLGLKTFEDLEDKYNRGKTSKKGLDTETGELVDSYFSVNFRKRKKDGTWEDIKLKGNTTKASLKNILIDKDEDWFNEIHSKFDVKRVEKYKDESKSKSCKEPITNLQALWEIIYDITNSDANKVAEIIETNFGFDKDICLQLAKTKFDDVGMGSLSAKAIRNILPLMSNGNNITAKAKLKVDSLINLNCSEEEKIKDKDDKLETLKFFITDKKARLKLSKYNTQSNFTYLNYWEATAVMYGSHSSKNISIKKEIERVENHSMNNPVVEKIVNETISIVNDIYKRYGFDEVRIELSRELKASMDERAQMWESMNNSAEKNEWAKQMLRELKKALMEDNRNADNIDDSVSTKSNIDKIRIIEDVVKNTNASEYKQKVKDYKLDEPTKAEVAKYLMWLEQNFKCPYTNQPIPLTDVFARGKVVQIEHIIPRERYYLNSYANKVITWAEVNQAKADNGNRTAYEFIVSKRIEKVFKIGNKEFGLMEADKWEGHIKAMFPKGGKRTNLLRKEIPEDPINRTLNETQYINKKLKEKLAELVGEQKVWVTSGAVTDILRERWHLNNIMKELLRNRFENFEMPTGKKTFTLKTLAEQEKMVDDISQALSNVSFEVMKISTGKKFIEIKDKEELQKILEVIQNTVRENIETPKKIKPYKYETSEESSETKSLVYYAPQFNSKTNSYEDVEMFQGFSKRLDHRHHALDAIIIACTKQNHIQYINTLNATNSADVENDNSKKAKYAIIKKDVCVDNSSKKFITPWSNDKFIVDVKNAMDNLLVAHKNTRLLISPSKNKYGTNKVASIRGELHKETNYAKKNYFEGDKTPIKKLIENIFKYKKENQYQSMVHLKNFDEIIKETILKENYHNFLIPLFEKYENEKLTDTSCKEFSKLVLKEIESKKLLFDSKTNKPFEWLSTYAIKDKAVRPNGLSMDLNSKTAKIDEIKSIADPRIKRIAEYRRNLIVQRKTEIDNLDIAKADKDKQKREVETLPLYSNAIYEVRIKKGENKFEWIELKDFNFNDLDKIEYAKKETTQLVKEKLKAVDFLELKRSYFDKPIFLSQTPIVIKKVRQKAYFQDLYEVTKGRYVYSSEMFMTYFFKNKLDEKTTNKREVKFLKYIDAVRIMNNEKPNQIDYSKLIDKEKSNLELNNNSEYDLLFTLAKNDLVYLPDNILEDVTKINWTNVKEVSNKLYIVKDMNPSRNEIVLQQFYKADSIKVSESDAKSLFTNTELKEQIEEIKYGDVKMMQRFIKVFTDKLGKKIVPFWEFPNGCWEKRKAIELGLL